MVDKTIGLITAVIMITALAIVVSRKANTAGVLNSFFSGIAKLQNQATAPVR